MNRLRKCEVVYILFKKKEILSFTKTRINVEGIILSKISQAKKDKYYVVGWCHVSQTHRNREKNGGCQRLGRGGNGERLVKGHRL